MQNKTAIMYISIRKEKAYKWLTQKHQHNPGNFESGKKKKKKTESARRISRDRCTEEDFKETGSTDRQQIQPIYSAKLGIALKTSTSPSPLLHLSSTKSHILHYRQPLNGMSFTTLESGHKELDKRSKRKSIFTSLCSLLLHLRVLIR